MKTTQNVPDLVSQLKGGSEHAFSELFKMFLPKICNVSRKMFLSKEDAEEIGQEVFLLIWKNRERLKCELSFNAYLLTILKSLIIKKARKEAKRIAYEKYVLRMHPSLEAEPESLLEISELETIAMAAVAKLPHFQKEVYILKNQKNMGTNEIAITMGISKRTVENHIYKASKSIKMSLMAKYVMPRTFRV
ncbi:sigma-70 family RNA polymerase sigma factor [Pararhodonellum marinum]|uniref:sigma-70 family RNA polymerase sigma factor n=1 Tax=Pararhodonellum marinum TaxID=2755358 RepID=UPI00188EBCC1|nr:sigma-70 family RNA polymerase sigma factor [Pararhodonellum marinum]